MFYLLCEGIGSEFLSGLLLVFVQGPIEDWLIIQIGCGSLETGRHYVHRDTESDKRASQKVDDDDAQSQTQTCACTASWISGSNKWFDVEIDSIATGSLREDRLVAPR